MKNSKNHIYFEKLTCSGTFVIEIILGLIGVGCFFAMLNDMINGKSLLSIDVLVYAILIIFFIIIILVLINFNSLTIMLTEDYIEARFGMMSKKIHLKDITSACIYKYKPMEFGGWGIKTNFKGIWTYNIAGDNYTGILMEYKTSGSSKKQFFSTRDPQKIIDLINEKKL